ncbi:MAG: tyrosine-protein phosphatase [Micromonosporaceae bacterium]
MPERGVRFENIFNFRDLGGYPTADGRVLRWGRLYRSDDLARLAETDRERFAALGIRTVVDLRRTDEVTSDGRIPQFDGFTYHHLHLPHPYWPAAEFADTADRARYLVQRYHELTTEAADGIGAALRLIADERSAPLVFHCIAGKDRTGVVAALTLSLLGVADADIAADFELSELAEAGYWDYRRRNDPTLTRQRWTHFKVCPGEGMLTFLGELRARHGSVAGYCAAAGVTAEHVDAMRAHLTIERAPAPA